MTAEPGAYHIVGGSASLVHTRPGLQSISQADDQGKISLTATGPGPKNEDGALEICARLVRTLNKVGGDWSVPEKGTQDIDRYSTNLAGNQLQMQVVRASNNKKLWQELNKAGSAAIDYVGSTAAREMLEAILKKAKRYPAEQKREMTLVLDAAWTPSHTFQRVLDAFRAQHLEECQEAGFAQVWAVGPQDSLVERLDR
ncbi:MAG: hypothetical protein WD894_19130 [Pirellulales bacterium]